MFDLVELFMYFLLSLFLLDTQYVCLVHQVSVCDIHVRPY